MVLGEKLARRGITATQFLTSRSLHARETVANLPGALRDRSNVCELTALTPPGGPAPADVLDTVVAECLANGVDLDDRSTSVIVGHEPRLSQLLTFMTGRRVHPIGEAEAVCVRSENLETMLRGHGEIEFRTAIPDVPEAQLRPKLGSKMTVAAL